MCLNTAEGIQLNEVRLLVPTLLHSGAIVHIGPHRLVYSAEKTLDFTSVSIPPASVTAPAQATDQLTTTAVIAFSPNGRTILWASRQARVWLPRYLTATVKTRVSTKVTTWLARIAPQAAPDALHCELPLRQMVLRLVERTTAHCLVVATEEDRLDAAGIARVLHLSLREGEVLLWLVAGKDRTEVGETLGISKRTIGKHCEHSFTKLGVTDRAAAIRLVVALRGPPAT